MEGINAFFFIIIFSAYCSVGLCFLHHTNILKKGVSTTTMKIKMVESTQPAKDILGQLVHFEKVQNFRSIVPGALVFRSAELDERSSSDLEKLNNEIQIRTVIDLRGESERKLFKSCCPLGEDFEIIETPQAMDLSLVKPNLLSAAQRCFRLSLLEPERQYAGMWRRMTPALRAQAAWWGLVSRRRETELYLGEINRGGLPVLYEVLLETSRAEICQALRVLATPENHPVVFHCVKGKDRTGLVAALAQRVAGVGPSGVVADYAASWGLLGGGGGEGGAAAAGTSGGGGGGGGGGAQEAGGRGGGGGIDWSKFKGTPPEAMQHALDFIDNSYGSVEEYLDGGGFGPDWRQQLRLVLHQKQQQQAALTSSSDAADEEMS